MCFAQHDPKNMPQYKRSGAEAKPEKRNRDHDLERLRAVFIGMSVQSSKGK